MGFLARNTVMLLLAMPMLVGARELTFAISAAETMAPLAEARLHVVLDGKEDQAEEHRTDALGTCMVGFDDAVRGIDVRIEKVGFFPKRHVTWSLREDGRERIDVAITMERAVGIGGFLLAPDGAPLAGAKLEIGFRPSDPPPDVYEFTSWDDDRKPVKTDATGRWSAQIPPPEGVRDVQIRYCGTDFFRGFGNDEYVSRIGDPHGFQQLLDGTWELKLLAGKVIRGIVHKPDGQPAVGARIFFSRIKDYEATTDAEGRFVFPPAEPGNWADQLLVWHPDYSLGTFSTDSRRLDQEIIITLPAMGSLTGKVVAPDGSPLPGVEVSITRPPRPLALQFTASTDDQGSFVLSGIALGKAGSSSIRLTVAKPGHMTVTDLAPSVFASPNPFVLHREIPFTITVSDAETGKPLNEFSYSYMSVNGGSGGTSRDSQLRTVINGVSTWDLDRELKTSAKVTVAGYETMAMERTFRLGEITDINFDFRLKLATMIEGTIRDDEGNLLSGVRLKAPLYNLDLADLLEREIPDVTSLCAAPGTSTDETGHYSLSMPGDEGILLLAVHEAGFRRTTFGEIRRQPDFQLEPWGSLEGVLRTGKQPLARSTVDFTCEWSLPPLRRYFSEEAITDPEGRFRFPKLPAGPYHLEISHEKDGHKTSIKFASTLAPGEVKVFDTSASGREVICRIAVPEDAGISLDDLLAAGAIEYALTSCYPLDPPSRICPGNWQDLPPQEREDWYEQWLFDADQEGAGVEASALSMMPQVYVTGTVDSNPLRLTVPCPGAFRLTLELQSVGQGVDRIFEVRDLSAGTAPIDIGALSLIGVGSQIIMPASPETISGRILLPDQSPAVGAWVMISDYGLRIDSTVGCPLEMTPDDHQVCRMTGADGTFSIPRPMGSKFSLKIIHDQGHALIPGAKVNADSLAQVVLAPWAILRGGPDCPEAIRRDTEVSVNVEGTELTTQSRTDAEGRFAFRVPAGSGTVSVDPENNVGTLYFCNAFFEAGKVQDFTYRRGWRVRGRIDVSRERRRVHIPILLIYSDLPEEHLPPNWKAMTPRMREQWIRSLCHTPQGKRILAAANLPLWSILCADKSGGFDGDGFAPGTYLVVDAQFAENEFRFSGILQRRFEIPALPPENGEKVIDLGKLSYVPVSTPTVGSPMPDLAGIGMDGKPWRLADMKGKPLLLYLYSTENDDTLFVKDMLPELSAIFTAHAAKAGERSTMILLAGFEEEDARDVIRKFDRSCLWAKIPAIDHHRPNPLLDLEMNSTASGTPLIYVDAEGRVARLPEDLRKGLSDEDED